MSWTVILHANNIRHKHVIVDELGTEIAVMKLRPTPAETEKNAHLTSAAPQLLEVAKSTVGLLETLRPIFAQLDQGAGTQYAPGMAQIQETFRWVIAKAEGREP
jgi:hypothetical protein